MRFKSLKDKVVVITGASSGIGKLSVEAFIQNGAKVVLAARSIDEMQEHLMELGMDLQHTLAYEADVSDYSQLKRLAENTIAHYGRIDVWVNNAAVAIYGLIEDIEADEISRLIDVNLKGQLYGSKVAIEIFKAQGYGNLINVSSTLGKTSAPLQSVYTAAKHGIVGFSSALREDLMQDKAHRKIEVSVVLPASMNTPFFKHAASRTGVEPKPIPPVYSPAVAVQAILSCAKKPKPEVIAGKAGKAMIMAYRLFPSLFERYMGKTGIRKQLSDRPEPPTGDDNLFGPLRGTYQIEGSFKQLQSGNDHRFRVGISVTAPLLLASWLIFKRLRKRSASTEEV